MPDMIRTLMVEQKLMYEEQIAQLRAERDEARREVCSMNETGLRMNESDKKREAKRRGWDCFSNKTEADANNTLFRTTDGE